MPPTARDVQPHEFAGDGNRCEVWVRFSRAANAVLCGQPRDAACHQVAQVVVATSDTAPAFHDEFDRYPEAGLPERAAPPSASADLAPDVAGALEIIERFGSIDGDHHKTWVIDQVVRKLLGKGYAAWLVDMKDGEDGPNTYDEWDEGIAP